MGRFSADVRDDDGNIIKTVSYDIKYFGSIEVDSDFKEKSVLETKFAKFIEDMIYDGNQEFTPPLSYRKGSAGSGSVQNRKDLRMSGLLDYTANMLSQKNILALSEDGDVIAFASFRHDYEDRIYMPQDLKSADKINYLTTIIVNPKYRKNGIADHLYNYLEDRLPESVHGNIVATRTWWSDDNAHLRLLQRRKYNLTCTLHNEREYNGAYFNTVYYCKRVNREQKNPRRIQ